LEELGITVSADNTHGNPGGGYSYPNYKAPSGRCRLAEILPVTTQGFGVSRELLIVNRKIYKTR
jgi:hypothetical protein